MHGTTHTAQRRKRGMQVFAPAPELPVDDEQPAAVLGIVDMLLGSAQQRAQVGHHLEPPHQGICIRSRNSSECHQLARQFLRGCIEALQPFRRVLDTGRIHETLDCGREDFLGWTHRGDTSGRSGTSRGRCCPGRTTSQGRTCGGRRPERNRHSRQRRLLASWPWRRGRCEVWPLWPH